MKANTRSIASQTPLLLIIAALGLDDIILALLSSSGLGSLSSLLRLSLPPLRLLLLRGLLLNSSLLAVTLNDRRDSLLLTLAATLVVLGGRTLGSSSRRLAAVHGRLDLLGGVLHALLVALDRGRAVLGGGFVPVDLQSGD